MKKLASLTVLGLLLASVSPIASADTPKINTESFTIEAWIAPQAYPWNWAPIVMQKDEGKGFYFGVDGDGRFGLHISSDGRWFKCNSKMPFPRLTTYHQWNSDRRAREYNGPGEIWRLISGGTCAIFKSSGSYATDYTESSAPACGRDRPCCGRDTPYDNKPCES